MCAAFQDPENAVKWCLHVQAELLNVDWPMELLTHPAAAEEWADVTDRVIYRVSPPQFRTPNSCLTLGGGTRVGSEGAHGYSPGSASEGC
jgi:hypothetical protein